MKTRKTLWTILLAALCTVLLAPAARAQPVNDDCSSAIAISEGATDYSTIAATTDGPTHADCEYDGQTYNDIWYTYTASCTGQLTISTCSTIDYDSDLAVYEGTGCPVSDAELLGCNDDGNGCSGFSSLLAVNVSAGSSYLIRVGGWNDGDVGTGSIYVACGPPANDQCSDAEPIALGTMVSSDSFNATNDGLGICDDAGGTPVAPANGVWYSVIGDGTEITASMCSEGTTLDSTLFVFCNSTGDVCAGPACVIADDDACGAGAGSRVSWCSENGTEYLLYVGGSAAVTGLFDLQIGAGGSCGTPPDCIYIPPAVPPNDDCANAISIGAGSTAFNTTNATTDGPEGPGDAECNDNGQPQVWNDIWYTYISTCDGLLQVDTCGTADYDSDLSVYDAIGGCPTDNTNLLACNDDGNAADGTPCADFTSFLRAPISAGQEVLIRVGGWGAGDFGSGTVNVTCIPETTDFCIFAGEVAIGGTVSDSTEFATTDPEALAEPCPGGMQDSPGRWYYVTGNGNQIRASLCASGDAYDSRMTVYCAASGLGAGDLQEICNDLQCNGDPVNTCSLNEDFDWCTESGRLYMVLVHGDFDSGTYQLDITDLGACVDDPACPVLPGCLTVTNNETELCGEDLNGGCNEDVPPCPDTDGDNDVDVDDLTNVILDWGNCCSNNGDTNGDGVVNVDDLTNIILGWGTLPGGCVDDRFVEVTSGDTINGTVWSLSESEGIRDTDWYRLTVGASGTVTVALQAELPVGNFIITDNAGDCDTTVQEAAYSDGCVPATNTVTGLTPGQVVYIWFGVTEDGSVPDFDAPCLDLDGTTNNQYTATVTSN